MDVDARIELVDRLQEAKEILEKKRLTAGEKRFAILMIDLVQEKLEPKTPTGVRLRDIR